MALGLLQLHPWELEKYTGLQLSAKLSGWYLLESKHEVMHYNLTRMIMQTTVNMSGRSLPKNKQLKPHELFRIPQIDGDAKRVDVKKLYQKARAKEKPTSNE